MTKAPIALTAFLAASTLLAACRPAPKPAEAAAPRAVRVARVQIRPLATAITVSGLLTPREEAAVTSELGGYRVVKVMVDQGDWVRKDQPLLQLDDTLLRAQIDQQGAILAQQEVAAERAESQARNVEGLEGKGVLSQEDLDTRRYSAQSARAAAKAAAAQLQDLKTRQARLTLRAPVAGPILARNVRPGDLPGGSTSGQPLFRIARDGLIELDAETPEAELYKLRTGQSADVTLPDGTTITGHVRMIGAEVDEQTKLGHARILLPLRKDLRPGGYARARLPDLKGEALTVPDKAVVYGADGASVFTVDAGDRAHRVPVKTGARAQGLVELLAGPPAGARVLITGSTFVLDGDKVRPIEGDSAP